MNLDWIRQNRAPLVRSGVLNQALRVALIEQALEEEQIPHLSPQELERLLKQFWQRQPLEPRQRSRWLAERDLSEVDLAAIVSRPQRWQMWCRQQWGETLGRLFLRHKDKLDVATASILRLEQEPLARELYLQLVGAESTFEAIARRHCHDHPQRQGGQWGPKPLHDLPPALAELIRTTPVGQLRPPQRLGPADWVVLRVETFQASRLGDPGVEQRLLRLEGEAWLRERIDAWLYRQAEREGPAAPL